MEISMDNSGMLGAFLILLASMMMMVVIVLIFGDRLVAKVEMWDRMLNRIRKKIWRKK